MEGSRGGNWEGSWSLGGGGNRMAIRGQSGGPSEGDRTAATCRVLARAAAPLSRVWLCSSVRHVSDSCLEDAGGGR